MGHYMGRGSMSTVFSYDEKFHIDMDIWLNTRRVQVHVSFVPDDIRTTVQGLEVVLDTKQRRILFEALAERLKAGGMVAVKPEIKGVDDAD
jgi:hypothetical protein